MPAYPVSFFAVPGADSERNSLPPVDSEAPGADAPGAPAPSVPPSATPTIPAVPEASPFPAPPFPAPPFPATPATLPAPFPVAKRCVSLNWSPPSGSASHSMLLPERTASRYARERDKPFVQYREVALPRTSEKGSKMRASSRGSGVDPESLTTNRITACRFPASPRIATIDISPPDVAEMLSPTSVSRISASPAGSPRNESGIPDSTELVSRVSRRDA